MSNSQTPAESGHPRHVGIIPDGNRRWAKSHGKPTLEGHQAGYKALQELTVSAIDRQIEYVTAYAFSTENWQRTEEEVGYLMALLRRVFKDDLEYYHKLGARLRFWGTREGVDSGVLKILDNAAERTKDNTAITLTLCFNYGGRESLVRAARAVDGEVTEASLSAALESHGTPDPDLIIRTSGEHRLSNFLLWEGAYSELYFTDTLWPDFDAAELDKALAEFAQRQRRFGA